MQVRGALVAGETCVVTADGALDAVEGEGQKTTLGGGATATTIATATATATAKRQAPPLTP